MTATLSSALPQEVEVLAESLLQAAEARGLRIATAESCTGGLLASLLTDIPGLGHAFERGFVVYTDEAKHELLGVDRDALSTEGAVSERVARQMAEGGLARSRADLCIAITGFAGRGGPSDEPGRVHLAAAARAGVVLHRLEEFGDIGRGEVRKASLQSALTLALDLLDTRPGGQASA